MVWVSINSGLLQDETNARRLCVEVAKTGCQVSPLYPGLFSYLAQHRLFRQFAILYRAGSELDAGIGMSEEQQFFVLQEITGDESSDLK